MDALRSLFIDGRERMYDRLLPVTQSALHPRRLPACAIAATPNRKSRAGRALPSASEAASRQDATSGTSTWLLGDVRKVSEHSRKSHA